MSTWGGETGAGGAVVVGRDEAEANLVEEYRSLVWLGRGKERRFIGEGARGAASDRPPRWRKQNHVK